MHRVGVDLGGTKIEAVLAGDGYRVLSRKRIRTPHPDDAASALADAGDGAGNGNGGGDSAAATYGRIIDATASLIGEVASAPRGRGNGGGSGGLVVGVCTPGSLLPGSELVANSNTRCLAGRPFALDLERAAGLPVRIENDANCFALAEASMGAGRGHRTVFGVIMGTGVGGGIVIDGAVHGGGSGEAGEWGHHTLHPGGRRCYCGRRGCAEAYLSGPSLEARWAELAAAAASNSSPSADAAGDGLAPPGAALSEISASLDGAAAAGRVLPPYAEQWRSELVSDFGTGLANVINILDPDAVVLGGGVSNVGLLYSAGARAVHENLLVDAAASAAAGVAGTGAAAPRRATPILRNMLGDSAGAVGACMLWP